MKPRELGPAIDRKVKLATKRAMQDTMRRINTLAKREVTKSTGIKQKFLGKRVRQFVSKGGRLGVLTLLLGMIHVDDIPHRVRTRKKRSFVSVRMRGSMTPLRGAFKAIVRGRHEGIFIRGSSRAPATWRKGVRAWLPISKARFGLSQLMDTDDMLKRLGQESIRLYREHFSRKMSGAGGRQSGGGST